MRGNDWRGYGEQPPSNAGSAQSYVRTSAEVLEAFRR